MQWFLCQFCRFLGVHEAFEVPSGTLGLGLRGGRGRLGRNPLRGGERGRRPDRTTRTTVRLLPRARVTSSGPRSRAEPSLALAFNYRAPGCEAPRWAEAPWAEGAVGGGGPVGVGVQAVTLPLAAQSTAKLTVTVLFAATYACRTARLLMLQVTRLSWEIVYRIVTRAKARELVIAIGRARGYSSPKS